MPTDYQTLSENEGFRLLPFARPGQVTVLSALLTFFLIHPVVAQTAEFGVVKDSGLVDLSFQQDLLFYSRQIATFLGR